jgi:transcriptional regulator with XRE-family HTH domain
MQHAASSEDRRRRELAEFFRDRRARLDPELFGFPSRRRRRTPGLRREDVAERAAVSVAWYTSLEQGRPVNPSRAVIAALADALSLSDTDRTYLFRLSGHTPPIEARPTALDSHLLQSLVDLVSAPAYCTDALTNVVAWNAPACEVFGDYSQWPPERRNLLTLLFTETSFAERLVDRDGYSDRVVQTFRGRSDAYLNDPIAIDMVDTLSRGSTRFKTLWNKRDVRRADTDTLEAIHPRGRMIFTMTTWQAVASPGVRFSAYLPADDPTMSALAVRR